MQKALKIILCIVCIFQNSMALCKELNPEQQRINSAIEIIKQYGFEKNIDALNGDNYTHMPVTIIFKDLSEVDFSYSKFYAITATDDSGNLFILINSDLRNSNVKALACLILHESNHCRKNIPDSLNEEMTAHTQEVMLYTRILDDDLTLESKTDDRLVVRLNKLKKIYDDAIKAYIANNTNYVNHLKIRD